MTDTTTSAGPGDATTAAEPEATGTALCVTDPGNPVCGRRMIAVDRLVAHPGNVREDSALTGEFCASVAENGVRVPLLITTCGDGGYRVIEGHRRLMAAVKAGLTEVPYDLDTGRAADEAGQFLDMVTANSGAYRKNFTALEEATALLSAHEAGATKTRIRKATGRKADQVKTALAAGGIAAATREQVGSLDRQLTLDELALVAEFESDRDALEQILRAVTYRYPVEHVAERIRRDRAERAEHARVRAELEASGCPVTGEIVAGSSLLTSLAHDGEDLTPETHSSCPGHGAFFRTHDLRTPVFYCTDPAAHGHVSRWAQPATPTATPAHSAAEGLAEGEPAGLPGADEGDDSAVYAPVPEPEADPAVEAERQRIAGGNTAWNAAWEVRKRWIAQLLQRRTAPKEVTRFIARQLLTMPEPLRRGLPAAAGRLVFTELAGKPLDAVLRDTQTCPATRVPLLALAPVAIAYESEMAGEGERRNTWRTGAWSPCPREDAAEWLRFLASLGYQLSGIEQAVADDAEWAGDDTEPDTNRTDDSGEPGETADAARSHAAGDDTADHASTGDPTDISESGGYPDQAVA